MSPPIRPLRSVALATATALAAFALAACTVDGGKLRGDGGIDPDPGGDYPGPSSTRPPDVSDPDSSAFAPGSRAAHDGGTSVEIGDAGKDAASARPDASVTPDASAHDAGVAPVEASAGDDATTLADATTTDDDASTSTDDAAAPTPDADTTADAAAPAPDAGPPPCGPLAAGDLAVVELMIQSASGAGDRGEWIEVQSTHADCVLDVSGVTIASPRGTTETDTVTIDALKLPPNGLFVVADSDDPTVNHDLPQPVYSWGSSDVLKNDGDTVTVTAADGAVIDTLTYPSFSPPVGRSVAFPVDCAWSDRSSWGRWSFSFHAYSGTLEGTPNADNDDVACY